MILSVSRESSLLENFSGFIAQYRPPSGVSGKRGWKNRQAEQENSANNINSDYHIDTGFPAK
jgi:hypothetical protein